MKLGVLAGGVGSARLLTGVKQLINPADMTVVVNTGDDERMRGLHVCPDVDTVLYHLADKADWDRGWGTSGETFTSNERYNELAESLPDVGVDLQNWFNLGDRDIATNMLRTRLLDAGLTLTESVDALRKALGLETKVIPMSNDEVRTTLRTTSGEVLGFQEYFVHRATADEIAQVMFVGASDAAPAPGTVAALSDSDIVLLPPSNPILSVGPVLAVNELREALSGSRGIRVAVSPIIGGRALKGPAARIMASLGHEVSPVGVAEMYKGLIDVFVLDNADADQAPAITALGLKAVVTDTVMTDAASAARLAREVLDVGR